MLRAAIESACDQQLHKDRPQLKEALLWLLNKVDKIASQRNDAIHAPTSLAFGIGGPKVVAAAFYGNPRARALLTKDLIEEFQWYSDSAEVLITYTRNLYVSIISDTFAWPDKPKMPTLGQKKNLTK